MESDPIPQSSSVLPTRRRSTLTVNRVPYPSYSVILVCLIFGLYKTAVNGVLTFGPIVISHFDHNDSHVGIYVMTAFWTGNAFAVIPASYLFMELGRKKGFAVGLLGVGLGLSVCIIGTLTENYLFLIGGIAIFGAGNSVLGFLRYAAAEVSKQNAVAKGTALTYVLSAGIISAALGPSISGICFRVVQHQQFVAAFGVMIVLVLAAAGILSRLTFPPLVPPEEEEEEAIRASMAVSTQHKLLPRRFKQIIGSKSFMMATSLAFVSTVGMDIFTSSVGIAMYTEYGISLSHVSVVFLVHFVGMTAPGLVSGWFTLRCGVYVVCVVGCLLKCCAVAIFFTERNFPGFLIGAAFLGVGWNFTFGCASMLVLSSTRNSETHKKAAVQSAMDFWVFMGSAIITLVTSSVYQHYKWQGVCIFGSVFIGMYVLGIVFIYLLDLEAEMHFENLMNAEDERREKEVELRRVTQAPAQLTSEAYAHAQMQVRGNPMHAHGLPTYSLDQTRASQDRLRGAQGSAGVSVTTGGINDTNDGIKAGVVDGVLPNPDPDRSRSESMDSCGSDEYSSVTPDASSIRTEYERAGSGRFRASLVREALTMDLGPGGPAEEGAKGMDRDEEEEDDDDDEGEEEEEEEEGISASSSGSRTSKGRSDRGRKGDKEKEEEKEKEKEKERVSREESRLSERLSEAATAGL